MPRADAWQRWHRLGTLLLLGVASGLPFDLTYGTLQLWFADVGIAATVDPNGVPIVPQGALDLTELGLFSLLALPYTLKPLWSPLLDRYMPVGLARLGRRRGWILVAQVLIAAGLVAMAMVPPLEAPYVLAGLALLVAFASATQDIVVDAYRTDLLPPRDRGLGATVASFGYRGGMLLAGAVAPIVATFASWRAASLVMAGVALLGLIATLTAPTEPVDPNRPPPRTLTDAIVLPFRNLLGRTQIVALLALVFLYKLGDAFAVSVLSPFLRKELGFDPAEIGTMKKTVGTIAVLVGMAIGGVAMTRMRLSRALLFFGILQAGTNLVLYALAAAGKDYALFAAATLSDNLASGLGAVAFVAFLTGLCDTRFSATQYALLGSIAQLGRALVGAIAGPTADAVGWEGYFLISTAVAIPGLLLVVWLSRTLDDLDPRPGRQKAVG